MLLCKLNGIKKSFGDRLIFNIKEFCIYEGDCIGLIGDNGAGKTTLLKLLTGELQPEEGNIEQYCSFTYFKQFEENAESDINKKLLKELQVVEQSEQSVVSGGEKTRLRLAAALSHDSHVLLADEPTSNLDMNGIQLLQDKLKKKNTFVLISHDRELLNKVCNRIIELRDQTLYFYDGNYSDYEACRELEKLTQFKEYEAYEDEKLRLNHIYEERMKKAKQVSKYSNKYSPREQRLRDFLSFRPHDVKEKNINKKAKSVLNQIEHLEVKVKPKEPPKIKLDFRSTNPPESKVVIEGKHLSFSYGGHVIFRDATFQIKNHRHVAIIGQNGAGKTTLLRLLQSSHEGIRLVPKASLGYLYQEFENLNLDLKVFQNIMEDSVQKESITRMILARLLFQESDLGKKVRVLSGGERMKLSFAKLLISACNILMLDEPTNYLDLSSMEAVEAMIQEYEGTVLFVSHDQKFIQNCADSILEVKDFGLTYYDGTYDKYLKEKEKPQSKSCSEQEMELMRLDLKQSELISKLSRPCNNRDKIEAEYQELCRQRMDLLRS